MTAPVCLVQPDLTIEQPDPRRIPALPPAHDMESAIAAINALRQAVYMLFDMLQQKQRPTNNTQQSQAPKPKVGGYTEVTRKMQTVRVYNPQDSSMYVDVEQIYALTMKDSVTGEQWTWKR